MHAATHSASFPGVARIYLWPFASQWYFDDDQKRYAQQIAIVTPIAVPEVELRKWPEFIAVEYLDEDLNAIGMTNFVLPQMLRNLDGAPIGLREIRQLLDEAP